jgi:hypothetical protein
MFETTYYLICEKYLIQFEYETIQEHVDGSTQIEEQSTTLNITLLNVQVSFSKYNRNMLQKLRRETQI